MGSVMLIAAKVTVSATDAIFSLVVKNRNRWQLSMYLLGVRSQLLLVALLVGFRDGKLYSVI